MSVYPMSHKSKGSNAERELMHMFWNAGFACVRAAGSGSTRHPCPDLLASNRSRSIAVECKASKYNHIYLYKEEVEELIQFASIFGSEPWIGVRFDKQPWFLIPASDLKETPKRFRVDLEGVKLRGVLFEELINN